MRRIPVVAIGLVLLLAGRAQAALVTYGFGCISPGVAAACATGEAQLRMDVRDTDLDGALLAPQQALFVFRNAGPGASSITDLYFDDGTLLGIAAVRNYGSGVDFSQGASPGNLPGGNVLSPRFEATAGFTADSNAPTAPNGANPGEQVGVLFNLLPGATFFDLTRGLDGVVTDASGAAALRVGIHVQAFAQGDSASFIAEPVAPLSAVPLPAPAWLMGAGLWGLLLGGRRRRLDGSRPAATLRAT
ncbi:MAG TPA: hypothetical protein VLI72_10550 [Methylibium sp.]|nr:hypothetical protein [Methylibium sp.]